ncbi:nuclear transport factor 2 family protein [Nocardioides daejeonensis]|uniref:nuclear transport factor 2 family protein n=1 Tax=Nocardioides daejeonensis TaxID=1046556 RepID=UPI000D748F37|nr:nuclear transport factor 2 family protein [Nocardioides daejeonensis]
MTTWTRTELDEAFAGYTATVQKCVDTGDWSHFADLFVDDATYIEHSYGSFTGKDEIRDWITKTMGAFPGNEMVEFPPKWVVIDEEKGWVITEIDNPMRDPGDGSQHGQGNISILRYAGDGLWREQEDVYNPLEFMAATTAYVRACERLGTLSDEARAWAAKFGVKLGQPR